MSQKVAPRIRPYRVGQESVLVVGIEGVVDAITDDTVTINGLTFPIRLDRERGIQYLSMVWPEGDETTCSRDHCDDACAVTPLAEDLQDDLDALHRMIHDEHEAHHDGELMRFCSHAICREAES